MTLYILNLFTNSFIIVLLFLMIILTILDRFAIIDLQNLRNFLYLLTLFLSFLTMIIMWISIGRITDENFDILMFSWIIINILYIGPFIALISALYSLSYLDNRQQQSDI